MTTPSVTRQTVQGEQVDLETVAEIITKKVHYRGASIKPRDIFDIAAAARHDRDALVRALKLYKDDVARSLATIARLKPEFVNAAISDLAIKDEFKSLAATALDEATALLRFI
jgi:chromosomal replication initiation ATPase DnaA